MTNRVAEGLPFVANDFINQLLLGIIAAAQNLTPSITVCSWVFLGNHYHGIIIPEGDPKDVAAFLNFVDGEIAKLVKVLLGKTVNCKIWAQRYHAALLVTPDTVIEKLGYLYANPVKANVVARASEWFGIGRLDPEFHDSNETYKYIPPSQLPKLPNQRFNKRQLKNLLSVIEEAKGSRNELRIEPFAWLKCFPNFKITKEKAAADILFHVASVETEEERKRKRDKRSLPSVESIMYQNPYKPYRPTKFGRRVFCISSCPELRAEFIALYEEFCAQCDEVWKRWKEGDLSATHPPGAFLPPRSPLANILMHPT